MTPHSRGPKGAAPPPPSVPRAMLSASSVLALLVAAGALVAAVHIRLYAVRAYGLVIHEFDPWFNFRAAEYMVEHGWRAFQAWFDEEACSPLAASLGVPWSGARAL